METLEKLAQRYQQLKAAEDEAKTARREAGEALASALEHPDEGSKTHKVGGYRITIKGTVNRKVDWELFDGVAFSLPPGIPAPVVVKRELDVVGLRWLQREQPEVYARIARAITAKPGAVLVEVRDV
jgi:hypothetical protein